MKLYLEIIGDEILNVDTEQKDMSNVEIDVENMDEFYNQTNQYKTIDEEIENEIKELLEENDEEDSLTSFQIKHWVSNRSFGELIDMYNNGEIVKPDMQREFVWDAQKSSRLIESIILGLPIPPLFLLEDGNNQYELIDGFQRITTLVNFVNGDPWNGHVTGKKKISSKLSGKVSKKILGKTFIQLLPEYQRMIKRSTIPLIEFKQIGPDDLSSKYLIFERINTGSEKLNPMQIRKSLAHGRFIKELYISADQCGQLKKLFSGLAIKKDQHVEAYLRTIVMSSIYYEKYSCGKSGINNLLNEYCESHRDKANPDKFADKFIASLELLMDVFKESKDIFRRVEKDSDGNYVYSGNMNISIMEAMLGVAIYNELSSIEQIEEKYKKIIFETFNNSQRKGASNPFSVSTGTVSAIIERFKICEKILVN